MKWRYRPGLRLFEDDPNPQLSLSTPRKEDVFAPLAAQLRPQHAEEFFGQRHLLDEGKPLRLLMSQRAITSMILWGPPGTGKTTLAYMLAAHADAELISLSAVLAGVKEVRAAMAQAQQRAGHGVRTILFVDEVHRFNKAQQDAFLPHVEKGTIVFIGATTENPSFEVNQALLSRARVFVLKPLSDEDLRDIVGRAADLTATAITNEAAELIVAQADGDARRVINLFELAMQFADGRIEESAVVAASGDMRRKFDKSGDIFYEQISALHKAVRGSNPDAALYWFTRMLDGGADPRYLGRRLVRMASEDIGNADPRALELTLAAVGAYERLGSPEGDLALAQATLYLASVPKSDAAYAAFNAAQAFVAATPSYAVPMHLRNAPTGLMKNLGYAKGYRHAHLEQTDAGGFAAGETYFPDEIEPENFYLPTNQGLEAKIKQRLERLAQLDQQATNDEGEV